MPKLQCDCIKKFNEHVADRNSRLECDLLSGAIVIRTIPAGYGFRRRSKPPYLICSYCPMCGKKYQ